MTPEIRKRLEKIRNLAEGATTENERLTAMATLQKEMRKYQITEAMLNHTEPQPMHMSMLYDGGKNRSHWREHLASVLCYFNGAMHMIAGGRISLLGQKDDCERITLLFSAFVAEIEYLASLHKNGKTWSNNYRLGCGDAIYWAMEKAQNEANAEARGEAATSSALMLVNNAITVLDKRKQEARNFYDDLCKKAGIKPTTLPALTSEDNPMARTIGRVEGADLYEKHTVKKLNG
jgi:hypothetical protein